MSGWSAGRFTASRAMSTIPNPQGIVVSVDVLQQGLLVRLPLDRLQLLP